MDCPFIVLCKPEYFTPESQLQNALVYRTATRVQRSIPIDYLLISGLLDITNRFGSFGSGAYSRLLIAGVSENTMVNLDKGTQVESRLRPTTKNILVNFFKFALRTNIQRMTFLEKAGVPRVPMFRRFFCSSQGSRIYSIVPYSLPFILSPLIH